MGNGVHMVNPNYAACPGRFRTFEAPMPTPKVPSSPAAQAISDLTQSATQNHAYEVRSLAYVFFLASFSFLAPVTVLLILVYLSRVKYGLDRIQTQHVVFPSELGEASPSLRRVFEIYQSTTLIALRAHMRYPMVG